ncbi:hypothetical protein ACHAXS_011840 [Conticribra weissflogii]
MPHKPSQADLMVSLIKNHSTRSTNKTPNPTARTPPSSTMTDTVEPSPPKRQPRIIRRKKKPSGTSTSTFTSASTSTHPANEIPAHIRNNSQLHHVISTTLPRDYEFEIPKTIWRIEKARARHVALQLPEGLLMYASTIGDILVNFSYRFRPAAEEGREGGTGPAPPRAIESLSVLGDVTYGACCIDDLSARALGCDLLVHYGHSCLVPLTCTVVPCLYVFVEIRVDVRHLVECFRMTFRQEEDEEKTARRREFTADREAASEGGSSDCGKEKEASKLVETLVMGTVQFRSAVVEAARLLNGDQDEVASSGVRFRAIVPQAKPLSPGEVLGCTAPSGLAELDFDRAMLSPADRRKLRQKVDDNNGIEGVSGRNCQEEPPEQPRCPSIERVMLFVADGRFHLEAAMISNPSLRALRYDPYSKTLTEERYEMVKMKKLRREAIRSTRKVLGIANYGMALPCRVHPVDRVGPGPSSETSSSVDDIANSILAHPSSNSSTSTAPDSSLSPLPSATTITDNPTSPPKTMGIILGTLGRQGNPAILSRIRSLLHSRGIRSIIVLLSEIFPKKLEMISNHSSSSPSASGNGNRHGVCAWVQIACPRLSVDWGHYFCVPVLSPFELFVALGEVADPSLWSVQDECHGGDQVGVSGEKEEKKKELDRDVSAYPMDFYSHNGGPWTNYYGVNKDRRVVSYGV